MQGEHDISNQVRGVVSQGLGLGRAPTLTSKSLRGLDVEISKISCGTNDLGMTAAIPPEDTFVLGIYLTELTNHEIWSRGRLAIRQGFAPNSMLLVNLCDEFAANITCPHQTLSFSIPRKSLDILADTAGRSCIPRLACEPGVIDPVVNYLAAALLPAFANPESVNTLFVDHLVLALCAHLASVYGAVKERPVAKHARNHGRLAPWQERRAKELIDANLGTNLSLAELASECKLSVGHFVRAFKSTMGLPPHRWLLLRRIDAAKQLLLTELPLVDIALKCGFADQSHFTRVFVQTNGIGPATWRRARRA
jgi:AraC family transcriptional regulator